MIIRKKLQITFAALTFSLSISNIFSQTNDDLIGNWMGTEDLISPNITFEYRNISIQVNEGGNREGFLVYTSSSNFLFNDNLNWAYHYKKFDKNTNKIIFLRRFITPVGTVGHEELKYDVVEFGNDFILANYVSANGDTYHQIRLNRTHLDLKGKNPTVFSSMISYPNPFNPITNIIVDIKESGDYQLKVFNVNGQEVISLHNGSLKKGKFQLSWNGMNDQGQHMASGIYFSILMDKGLIVDRSRMILLK
jgi:hypothetical protein